MSVINSCSILLKTMNIKNSCEDVGVDGFCILVYFFEKKVVVVITVGPDK